MTHRWTLRETDLYNYAMSLRELDAMRVDGKFVDADGNKVGHLPCCENDPDSAGRRTICSLLGNKLTNVLGSALPLETVLRLDLQAYG